MRDFRRELEEKEAAHHQKRAREQEHLGAYCRPLCKQVFVGIATVD